MQKNAALSLFLVPFNLSFCFRLAVAVSVIETLTSILLFFFFLMFSEINR